MSNCWVFFFFFLVVLLFYDWKRDTTQRTAAVTETLCASDILNNEWHFRLRVAAFCTGHCAGQVKKRLGKGLDWGESRISGSKHHAEADAEAAPPPHNYPLFSVQPCGILFLHYQDHQTKFISNLWKYWTTGALNCHLDASSSREPLSGRAHFFFWSLLIVIKGAEWPLADITSLFMRVLGLF